MNENFKTKFGLRIKELQRANKLTQEQLAEKMDMERSNLAKIEAGRHFPSAENIEKFARVFNIDVSELFNFGHFKNKENLIDEIMSALNNFDADKIQYAHKAVMNLKSLK